MRIIVLIIVYILLQKQIVQSLVGADRMHSIPEQFF